MDYYLKISKEKIIFIESIMGVDGDEVLTVDKKSDFFDFSSLLDGESPKIIPEKYQKIQNFLKIPKEQSMLTVPRHVVIDSILNLKKAIQKVQEHPENKEYMVTHLQIKKFLRGLSKASICTTKLNVIATKAKNASVISTINSFLPDAADQCKKIRYSTTKTATGRLTVLDGPKILTAPGSIKSCLKSSYKDGKIIQIDISSAEPRFALHIKGDSVSGDVYNDIIDNVIKEKITRKQAKLITLCALYGQSPKKLKEQLPDNLNATDIIRKTKEYFGYSQLFFKLRSALTKGNLRNALGRPIRLTKGDDHLLISYFLQSSIAEGSILMFSDFVNKNPDVCKPIFVIHDALVLDCTKEFANSILEKDEIQLQLGDWKFSTHISVLNNI